MFRGVERLDTTVVTLVLLTLCTTSTLAVMSCEDARLRCAYRSGCGMALQQYLTRCSSVLRGAVGACPEICLHALVALTSTDEGKEFMTVSRSFPTLSVNIFFGFKLPKSPHFSATVPRMIISAYSLNRGSRYAGHR